MSLCDYLHFNLSKANGRLYLQHGLHATALSIAYKFNDKKIILDLKLNDNLLPKDHFISYQEKSVRIIKNFTDSNITLCHYHVSNFNVRLKPMN